MLRACLTGLAAASLLSGTAIAREQTPDLPLNRPVRGALETSDKALASGERIDSYVFQVEEGQTYQIALSSDAFDTYLIVRGPGGLSEDNDDEAQGVLNSRVRFTAQASGEVQVGVTSVEAGETGAYEILLVSGEAAMQGAAPVDGANQSTLLSPGQPINAALEEGDRALENGEFIDGYAFHIKAGRSYEVTMTSTAIDAYLMLRGPEGFSEENDDEAEGVLNSRVRFTATTDGQVTVGATSATARETGAYQLSLTEN
jgi:hypothetical protein